MYVCKCVTCFQIRSYWQNTFKPEILYIHIDFNYYFLKTLCRMYRSFGFGYKKHTFPKTGNTSILPAIF